MAPIRPNQVAEDDSWDDEQPVRRRKAVRFALPVAVAGVAAATIGLVPALADTGDPELPEISAEELISKIAASDTQQLSGSVKITTDLGIPSLPSGMSFGSGASRGGEQGAGASTADPASKLMELAAGSHTLRLAVDGPERQRISIIEDAAEYSLIHNADEVWAYDSASDSVYHGTAPREAATGDHHQRRHPEGLADLTPQQIAEQALAAVDDTTEVTVDGTAKVAGRDAYELLVRPHDGDTTVGSVRIAVDADQGVPLRFTLTPKGGGKAVIDVRFTEVDFGKPSASRFDFTPPKGAKITEEGDLERSATGDHAKGEHAAGDTGPTVIGEGWDTIAEFTLPGGTPAEPEDGPLSSGDEGATADLLDSLGSRVKGDFGSGTLFGTRLVNALLTDDGTVFVGAVDKDALVKAANKAK